MTPDEALKRAMWAGDVDELSRLAPCDCCCDEHFFEHCPAMAWGGCRGFYSLTRVQYEEWVAHYAKYHGMTREQFEGITGMWLPDESGTSE